MGQEKYVLYYGSQSVIHLSKNPTFDYRSKHIGVQYHWIQDALEMKQFELEKIRIDHNGSDMISKALPMEKLSTCREVSGMAPLPT